MIHEIAQKFGMDTNGYASFHNENFLNSPDLPCYIPENAEDRHDIFTRNDIDMQVREWLDTEEAKDYLVEAYDGVAPEVNEEFINNFVVNVYESLTWEYPSTYLDNLLN